MYLYDSMCIDIYIYVGMFVFANILGNALNRFALVKALFWPYPSGANWLPACQLGVIARMVIVVKVV